MQLAPLSVPVEVRIAASHPAARARTVRWFRLSTGIGLSGIRLRSPLPRSLIGVPLEVRVRLPSPIDHTAGLSDRAAAEVADELCQLLQFPARASEVRAPGPAEQPPQLRHLSPLRLLPEAQQIIDNYVTARNLSEE